MNIKTLSSSLVRDEGLRLKTYRCTAGKLTIGVGRNLDDCGITPAEAMALLANDIATVEKQLDAGMPWWRQLDEPRQHVIANMAFNLGTPGLLKFKNTLALMQAGKFDDAAHAMLASKWAGQVGARATRLARQMIFAWHKKLLFCST